MTPARLVEASRRIGAWRCVPRFRVRTLMLAVLAVAGVFGLRIYLDQRAVIREFMGSIERSRELRLDWSGTEHDRVYGLSSLRGSYLPSTLAVDRVGARSWACSELVGLFDRGMREGDFEAVNSSVAMLAFLGRGDAAARDRVARIARAPASWLLRHNAILALCRFSEDDDRARAELVKLLGCRDRDFERWHILDVINELGRPHRSAMMGVPALLARFRSPPEGEQAASVKAALAFALRLIGPDAREAAPDLMACASDRAEESQVRIRAIDAIAAITIFVGPNTELPDVIAPEVLATLKSLADEPIVGSECRGILNEVARRDGWNDRIPWPEVAEARAAALRRRAANTVTETRRP